LGQGIQFNETPPYEVLETPEFSTEDIARFKRFARYCDLYYNKKNFQNVLPLLWETADTPYDAFAGLADYVWEQEQKTHQIPLARLAELLFRYLVEATPPRSETDSRNDRIRFPATQRKKR
jgi:hypothetical protein